ncbi:Fc.00g066090.m01.CDS01 [Cosmosporella sp. VM-42]
MFKSAARLFPCPNNTINRKTKMSGGPGHDLAATSAGGNTSARRKGEDVDTVKLRLVDQDFKIGRFRDPFAPRGSVGAKKYPSGVTAEDEQKWLALIKNARDRGDIL